MPAQFNFQQFQQMTPLDGANIWAYILDHNADRIGVKRRKPALENLEKIFNATFRLANEVGFSAMNLRDLCRETGLSMGGLYGYISGKDQLAAMIEDVVRHATHEIPRMFIRMEEPQAQLEHLLRGSIYLSEILQPWFYFVYLDSRVLPAQQRNMAKDSELHMQTVIAGLLARIGDRRAYCPDLLAAHILAMSQDWYVKRWKYRAARVGVDQFADSTVRFVRSYLSAGALPPSAP